MNIKTLALEAVKKGICGPGVNRILASPDKKALIEYYLEGIDFCLNKDFPSNEYLKTEGGELLAEHGIYVDEEIGCNSPSRMILLGKSFGRVLVDRYIVSDIFVKHTSKLIIEAKDHSFLRIDCFDGSEVKVDACDDAKVLVNVYGNSKVTYQKSEKAQVKVIYKGKEIYK